MIKDDNEKEVNLKKAMYDFEIANKYIQETIKNLQNSQKNLNLTKQNFNDALSFKSDSHKNPHTNTQNFKNVKSFKVDQKLRTDSEIAKKYEYNMSIEEKAQKLTKQFLTVIIRDELNQETIVFNQRNKNF